MSACVSVTPVVPSEGHDQLWQARTEYLYQQDHWTVHLSLIGVTEQQKFKTRAQWEQQGDHYTIKLRDFLGRTIAVIEGSPSEVHAKTSKGQHFKGDTAEQLIQQLFDIQIPVSGMRYWLLGLPKPDMPITQLSFDQRGLAQQLEQQAWSLQYPSYKQNDSLLMPEQILLDYSDIDLTVKISRWAFHSE